MVKQVIFVGFWGTIAPPGSNPDSVELPHSGYTGVQFSVGGRAGGNIQPSASQLSDDSVRTNAMH